MKYIAKMMLALLASVTLVAQAYAWDFGVKGSASATFNQAPSWTQLFFTTTRQAYFPRRSECCWDI